MPNRVPVLTVAMRSCLLRTARHRLEQIHELYDSASEHGDIQGEKDLLSTEIACVTAAIAWLWLQPATDEASKIG